MFGLYPAGAHWVRHFSARRAPRDLGKVLTAHAGFSAGIFHTPFGEQRGAVIAQSGRFLVLTATVNVDRAELAVVPDVQMQNLLWSFETGYANQWGPRELLALTGIDNWDGLLRRTSAEYAAVCKIVSDAVDASLEKQAIEAGAAKVDAANRASTPDPIVGRMFYNDDDPPWLPSDYLFDTPEVQPCAH